jgi:hypothetical protein
MKFIIISLSFIAIQCLKLTTFDSALSLKGLNTQSKDILKILNINQLKGNKTIDSEIEEAEILKHKSNLF